MELRPNGGSALERLAAEGDPKRYRFALPLKKYKDCNFSYAGMKTAVRLAVEHELPEGPNEDNRQVKFPETRMNDCLQMQNKNPWDLEGVGAKVEVQEL